MTAQDLIAHFTRKYNIHAAWNLADTTLKADVEQDLFLFDYLDQVAY